MDPSSLSDFDIPESARAVSPLNAPAGWPPAARSAAGCGLGCAGLVLVEALVLWAAVSLMFNLRVPPGVSVRASAPPQVVKGRKFPVTLTVKNDSGESVKVTAVTARPGFLEQFTLSDPEPAPRTGMVSFAGNSIWSFEAPVAAGKAWSVRFQATALRDGELKAPLEVSVNMAPRTATLSVKSSAKAPADTGKPAPAAGR